MLINTLHPNTQYNSLAKNKNLISKQEMQYIYKTMCNEKTCIKSPKKIYNNKLVFSKILNHQN
jgi:hypothetical protein